MSVREQIRQIAQEPGQKEWQAILQQAAALRALADNLVQMIMDRGQPSPKEEDTSCQHPKGVEVTTMGDAGVRRWLCPNCDSLYERPDDAE